MISVQQDVLDRQIQPTEDPCPNLQKLKDLLLMSQCQILKHTFRGLSESRSQVGDVIIEIIMICSHRCPHGLRFSCPCSNHFWSATNHCRSGTLKSICNFTDSLNKSFCHHNLSLVKVLQMSSSCTSGHNTKADWCMLQLIPNT